MTAAVSDAPAQALAARRPQVVTAPGIYDMPIEIYHGREINQVSLSSSGAKKLHVSCPALFRYEQIHARPPKREFEIGTAAHVEVLGTGPELVKVDAVDWRTAKAKAEVAEVRERGAIPLKPAEFAMVKGMAAALRQHPTASRLLSPAWGVAEQSLFWRDEATGVTCRARPDVLPHPSSSRVIMPDYKSCDSASLDAISRAMDSYGYCQQAPWYLDGAVALGRADEDAVFAFVFQEKAPPYLVRVVQLDALAIQIGRMRNRRALLTFAACMESGDWPEYPNEIETVTLPPWAENKGWEEL